MVAFKFLHILTMFATVTLFVGGEVILTAVARSRDVGTLRRVVAITSKTDGVGLVLFLAGIGFGLVTALLGGLDLTAPWLVIAYVLVGILILSGVLYFLPYGSRVAKALEASPDRFSPELERLFEPRRQIVTVVLDVIVWAVLIFVMVVKPFS